mgnify:CR=1 FL=1
MTHKKRNIAKSTINDKELNKPIRLNKFLADAGITSRRKADEIISDGKVMINGIIVTNKATTVLPTDVVSVQGNIVKHKKRHLYILLNKPKDYITTVVDEQGRKTVLHLINIDERIYPVGRLDRNTTGVLLLTNDGELAYRLTHPKYEIQRLYSVVLDKPLRREYAEKIAQGIDLDGETTSPCEIFISPDDHKKLTMILKEGKNREVKRIFEKFGLEVRKLDRKMFAGLTTQGLKRGEFRFLNRKEILALKKSVGLEN